MSASTMRKEEETISSHSSSLSFKMIERLPRLTVVRIRVEVVRVVVSNDLLLLLHDLDLSLGDPSSQPREILHSVPETTQLFPSLLLERLELLLQVTDPTLSLQELG